MPKPAVPPQNEPTRTRLHDHRPEPGEPMPPPPLDETAETPLDEEPLIPRPGGI